MDFFTAHQNELMIGIITDLIVAAIIGVISWMRKWPPIKVPIWVIIFFVAVPIISFTILTLKSDEIVPIVDKKFDTEIVVLDGKKFIRCDFDRCTLIFKGKKPFGIEHCNFTVPKFIFEDDAATTLYAIRLMQHDSTFKKIIWDAINKQ